MYSKATVWALEDAGKQLVFGWMQVKWHLGVGAQSEVNHKEQHRSATHKHLFMHLILYFVCPDLACQSVFTVESGKTNNKIVSPVGVGLAHAFIAAHDGKVVAVAVEARERVLRGCLGQVDTLGGQSRCQQSKESSHTHKRHDETA
jgi:hypothetical protein